MRLYFCYLVYIRCNIFETIFVLFAHLDKIEICLVVLMI